jgi:VanZ family protein
VKDQASPKWRASVIRYAPLFLWIGVIFFLSSPEGSANQTSRIIGPLLHFFFPNILPETQATVHAIVRKTAHFTEYAVLAFLAVRAFSSSARRYLIALLFVVMTASLDEFNQSFEPSRTSSFWDVLLDISGGFVMIALLWAFDRRRNTGR